jgi:tetratricopeptide (TPR) repeat protein
VQQILGDNEVNRLEQQYDYEPDEFEKEEQKRKKANTSRALLLAVIVLGMFFYFMGQKDSKPKVVAQVPTQEAPEEVVDEPEEVSTPESLDPDLASLPIGVQRQLVAELEVGTKLFQNYQFELCEDRAKQILIKAPNYKKALDLLDVCIKSKQELLAKKKEEESLKIRQELEQKLEANLRLARKFMSKKQYDKVKEVLATIFEIDATNKEAQEMQAKINQMEEDKKQAEEKKVEVQALSAKYMPTFNLGERFFKNQEYRKAIETYSRLVSIPTLGDPGVERIKKQSKERIKMSAELLNEAISPELAIADEMIAVEQYKEAIEAYNRVLKLDYKNTNSKKGIEKAKKAIDENAADSYRRASISESVSDFKNACLLYNAVLDISLPKSRYYNLAEDKVKRLCK